MKWLYTLIALVGIISSSGAGIAQDLDDTPLARCSGYEKYHPLVSELAWSVSCLLQAIHDRDKRIIAELSAFSRCGSEPCEPEGILDEGASEYIFGINGTGKARYPLQSPKDAIRTVLTKSNTVLIVVAPTEKRAHVTVIPRTGKDSVAPREGLNQDYFECFFSYDAERSIWVISFGFCLYATGTIADEENPDIVVDLTGSDAGSIPVMVWRPKT